MSEQKFSDFTLNFNPGARGNDKAPTLRGKATVRAGDSATEFDVAAWGPNHASTGGPDFYNVTFTPKDPALAALANARTQMIATLDSFRDTLEDLGGGLGVTDPVAGPVVLALK
jgi:hypothetical protein